MYANGFRYYFTPLPGYFSPFPHGTCPLSVTREYLGLAGGPARFARDFSGPVLLGILLGRSRHFVYGGSTLYDWPFNTIRLYSFVTLAVRQKLLKSPATPTMQRLPAITHDRFSLFRFRSPLLTESRLFSLPVGTEMFHFPTFPLPALYIQAGVTGSSCDAQRGFPIRKSSDHSSIISSPRLIADLYVLLRLQMPRHPPSALRNLISHEYESIAGFRVTPESRIDQ